LRYVAAHHAKDTDDPNITKELTALGIRLHLNSALAQLKTNQDAEVIKSTTRALEIDGISESEKAKAFYRRGRAHERGNEHELAVEDLKRALALNPNDSGVLAELNCAKDGLKMRREMEKKTYSKIFS
jgi:peptidyl-prolyl isomerase D